MGQNWPPIGQTLVKYGVYCGDGYEILN